MKRVVIIGAGIAGASLGAEIARDAEVTLVEMEDQPGYHATGRSAAFWQETYGGPGVQPLTSASGPILEALGILGRHGALHIGRAQDEPAAQAFLNGFRDSGVALELLSASQLGARIPGLRDEWVIGIEEPSCADIDAAALHGHYLSALRRAGGRVLTSVSVKAGERAKQGWRLTLSDGDTLECDRVVNAAGAWADGVARACGVGPVGIAPLIRTMVQLRTDPEPLDGGGPVVMHLGGQFYFKPQPGGRLWLSPHDETPSDPCDAAPEELAVAEAIDRFEHVVDWKVVTVERRWAGLRSFAPDRLPVYGYDPLATGFFWFAGQGGFGLQTAPAAALLGRALLLEEPIPAALAKIDPAVYDPGRFE